MSEIDLSALPPAVRREVEARDAKIAKLESAIQGGIAHLGDEIARADAAEAERARLAVALEAAEKERARVVVDASRLLREQERLLSAAERERDALHEWWEQSFLTRLGPGSVRLRLGERTLGRRFMLTEVSHSADGAQAQVPEVQPGD